MLSWKCFFLVAMKLLSHSANLHAVTYVVFTHFDGLGPGNQDCHSTYWWLPPRGSYCWQQSISQSSSRVGSQVTVISLQHQYESYVFNLQGVCFNAVTHPPTRSLWAPQACGHRRCACQVLGNSWQPVAPTHCHGF